MEVGQQDLSGQIQLKFDWKRVTMHATFHDLEDTSVFITGGGSGIGAALTEGFLAQGARVAFVQRSDASGFVAAIKCDVTDVTALQAAIKSAADAHGPITTLVNNAAWDNRRAIEGFTPDEWDGMMTSTCVHISLRLRRLQLG